MNSPTKPRLRVKILCGSTVIIFQSNNNNFKHAINQSTGCDPPSLFNFILFFRGRCSTSKLYWFRFSLPISSFSVFLCFIYVHMSIVSLALVRHCSKINCFLSIFLQIVTFTPIFLSTSSYLLQSRNASWSFSSIFLYSLNYNQSFLAFFYIHTGPTERSKGRLLSNDTGCLCNPYGKVVSLESNWPIFILFAFV